MAIHSFLKAEKGDPDWQFTPEDYFEKEFKIIDANNVDVSENAEEQVILRLIPSEKTLLAKNLNIRVQRDASLDLLILNDLDPKLQQVFLYNIHLEPGASLALGMFVKNGKFNKHIVQVLLEEFSSFTSYGIVSNYCGGDSEIINKVKHQGRDSKNNQLFLGMAGKDSQIVFQSMNISENNASHLEIGLDNACLALDPSGRCFSKAENYVDSNYSEISQRCTSSTINFEKIMYLQSKGIPEKRAKNMIIDGFKKLVFDVISQDKIREEIKTMYNV